MNDSSSKSFAEFNLRSEILRALDELNFVVATPIQALAIPVALTGRDLVAGAQTGTGKTAAFALPLVQRLLVNPQERALILAPTRELAIQIHDFIKALTKYSDDVRPSLVIGGLGMRQQKAQLRNNPRVIVATPGRLVDHLQQRSGDLQRTHFLVLDEADRMLDMGFGPQLNQILRALPSARQTLLFSATIPTNILNLAQKFLKDPEKVSVGEAARPAEKIDHQVIETTVDAKRDVLLNEIKKREGTILIFTRTKARADKVVTFLLQKGLKVAVLHGDKGQLQRQEALQGFRDGTYRILVATDIAARGLDIPHIAHVINFELPQASEDFVHRIGRTARNGSEGSALSLLAAHEQEKWWEIQKLMNPSAGPGVFAPVRATVAKRPQGGSRPQHRSGPPPKKGKVGFKFGRRR